MIFSRHYLKKKIFFCKNPLINLFLLQKIKIVLIAYLERQIITLYSYKYDYKKNKFFIQLTTNNSTLIIMNYAIKWKNNKYNNCFTANIIFLSIYVYITIKVIHFYKNYQRVPFKCSLTYLWIKSNGINHFLKLSLQIPEYFRCLNANITEKNKRLL